MATHIVPATTAQLEYIKARGGGGEGPYCHAVDEDLWGEVDVGKDSLPHQLNAIAEG